MSARTTFLALLCFAAQLFVPTAVAIDRDQVIDPKSKQQQTETGAQEPDPMQGIFSGEGPSTGAFITFLGYAIILGALAVAVWYIFKRGLIRKPFAKGEGKLKVAETRMLGNRQFIMVVEYEDQKILLGVGPGKIDYLTNLHSYRGEFPQIAEAPQRVEGGFQ